MIQVRCKFFCLKMDFCLEVVIYRRQCDSVKRINIINEFSLLGRDVLYFFYLKKNREMFFGIYMYLVKYINKKYDVFSERKKNQSFIILFYVK